MKQFLMLTLATALTGVAVSTKAQTADEVVNKHVDAMGGAAKLKTIKTAVTEGTLEVQGMEFPFKATIINNRGMRMEFEAMGTQNIQVATTTGGWTLMPVQQQTEPVDVPAADLKGISADLDLEGELVDSKTKGNTLELIGKEAVNGVDNFKLKVTRKDGTVAHYYIDSQTYYISKRATNKNIQGQDVEIVDEMKDYKKSDDGFVYASLVEQAPMGIKIKVTKQSFNGGVDEKVFEKPAK